MYRRPKFLEVLLDIRQEMAREADYDVDLFAEIVRSGRHPGPRRKYAIGGEDDNGRTAKARPKKTPTSGGSR
jgi:hypothetical protein